MILTCRVWTDEQKRALVASVCEPGASVAEIARRVDLRPSQLYRWRRDLAKPVSPGFVAVTVSAAPDPVAGCAVVLELGGAVLHQLIEAHVLAAERLHGDDTTVPVLAKTKTDVGRQWTYVRDDRPFGGPAPLTRV